MGDGCNYPKKGNQLKVHFDLFTADGQKIDSSRDEGVPFSFTLGKGEVIELWDQVLKKMCLGQKIRIEYNKPDPRDEEHDYQADR